MPAPFRQLSRMPDIPLWLFLHRSRTLLFHHLLCCSVGNVYPLTAAVLFSGSPFDNYCTVAALSFNNRGTVPRFSVFECSEIQSVSTYKHVSCLALFHIHQYINPFEPLQP